MSIRRRTTAQARGFGDVWGDEWEDDTYEDEDAEEYGGSDEWEEGLTDYPEGAMGDTYQDGTWPFESYESEVGEDFPIDDDGGTPIGTEPGAMPSDWFASGVSHGRNDGYTGKPYQYRAPPGTTGLALDAYEQGYDQGYAQGIALAKTGGGGGTGGGPGPKKGGGPGPKKDGTAGGLSTGAKVAIGLGVAAAVAGVVIGARKRRRAA